MTSRSLWSASPLLCSLAALTACGTVTGTDPDPGADVDASVPSTADAADPIDGSLPDAPEAPARNVVFVTSEVVTGNLRGRSGADDTCNRLASAAGRAGTFRAWLSTDSENAITRIEGVRGWVRPDGRPVADLPADVAAGNLMHTIRLDERAQVVPAPFTVITATRRGERLLPYGSCTNWSSTEGSTMGGDLTAGGSLYSALDTVGCNREHRLYCFQVDHSEPVVPTRIEGRLAFISKTAWKTDGGLVGADAHCQGEADRANVVGRFRAALATSGASAASRFLPADGPWRRSDGIQVIASTAELADDSRELDAPISQAIDGTEIGLEVVITGSTGFGAVPADAAQTCNDWRDATTATSLYFRRAAATRKTAVTKSTTCGEPRRLLCLQTTAR